ncbi:hypothetical protein RJ639_025647 [Escallonia herrerae]|uniref:RIN4 pathogenic type III effector avirulence factor Avr cleavage site domain-containing protein n=1 Tax=Escallonia herrerae TaxID=1293975 RepID=A0AA88UY27_9ASTE|nr:hypothetical protein RJ639_025647 [Escallonia herrerae]
MRVSGKSVIMPSKRLILAKAMYISTVTKTMVKYTRPTRISLSSQAPPCCHPALAINRGKFRRLLFAKAAQVLSSWKTKNAPWLSVPQFGDWDLKGQVPDYSMDFSKIREMRKQNKRDVSRASLGNEEELISSEPSKVDTGHGHDGHHHNYHQDHSPTVSFFGLPLASFDMCVLVSSTAI